MPSPSPSLRSPASPVSPLLFRILSLSLPSLLLQLLLFLPSTLTLLSLPTAAVSAYGVSSLTSNVSCIMILYGALQSLDTLLPVRFTDDPKTMYKVCKTCIFLTTAMTFPLLSTWYIGGGGGDGGQVAIRGILVGVGIRPSLSSSVCSYLRYYGMAFPFLMLYNVYTRFLTAQGVVYPQVIVAAVAVVVHIVLIKVYLEEFTSTSSDVDVSLIMSATGIMQGVNVVMNFSLLMIYTCILKPQDERTIPSLSSFLKIGEVFDVDALKLQGKLSFAGVLSLSEWLYWETLMFFVSSYTPAVSLTAQSIIYNLIPLLYMIPLGISIGGGVVVGNFIGEGMLDSARSCCFKLCKLGLSSSLGVSLLLFVLRPSVIGVFTTDVMVVKELSDAWLGVCMFIAQDHLFSVQAGILKSLGMQAMLSKLIICVLGFVGVPSMYLSVKKSGFVLAWRLMWAPYFVLNALMYRQWKSADFEKVRDKLRKNSENNENLKNKAIQPNYVSVMGEDEGGAIEEGTMKNDVVHERPGSDVTNVNVKLELT